MVALQMALSVAAAVPIAMVVALLATTVARADDESFLQYTSQNGIYYGGTDSPEARLSAGRAICENLRYGGDARTGLNFFVTQDFVSQTLIDAAQRELCPETLPENERKAGWDRWR